MADTKDYLTEYKEFFEYFPETVDPDDQLPVRVAGYSLWEPELPGAAIDWTLQYLSNRRCPRGLLAPLARLVAEEVKQLSRTTPQALGFDPHDNCYMPLKLMQAVICKVNEVCLRFCNNGSINTLPPPSSGPVISSCAVKNSRRSMEDRHVILEDFHGFFNIKDASPASFYAVFDGHAGIDAAIYSVSHLHQYIAESPSYPTDPEKAIKDAFFRTDNLFVEKSNKENLSSGTTAVCALLRLKEKKLYVAWLGDSQAILMRQGQLIKLVNPHKPEREDEMARIQDMGGKVWFWGTWRVNGQLAVSRAIGDSSYKPYVTAEPDVTTVDLHGDEDFFILACDGLWDFVSAEDVAQAVYTQLLQNPGDVGGVSERLVCLSKLQGSADNISVIVVFLCAPSLLAAQLRRRLHSVEQQQEATEAMEEEQTTLLLAKGKQGEAAAPPPPPAVTANGSASGAGAGFGGDEFDFDPFGSTPAAGLLRGVDLALGRGSDSKADADEELQRQQGREFDPEDEPRRDTPTPPADQVPGVVGLVSDNVAESGEESEDEWNYYKAEPTEKPTVEPPPQAANENEKEKQAKQEVCKEQSEEAEDSDENMESQLNPNAAEFIPSPTHSKPSMEELLLELHKTQTADANTLVNDNISSPDLSEEQDKEPSMDEFLLSLHKTQNADANTLCNDKVSSPDLPEHEKDYENRKEFSPAQNEKSLNPFVDDLNVVGVESLGDGPSVGLDDSATFSTKAEYGDESTASGTDFLKMEASSNVMETSLMEQDFLAYEEQTDDTKVLENSVESPVSEQNSEIEINVPNDDQKEPVHISFELQKEIAPHMELQPEIVQVDNDDQSPILDSNQELQTTSAPEKNFFNDEMDFTNLLPKSINETPEIESYMTETKPTLEESAVVATEVMQDLSSNIQEAIQNEEWRTHENFVEESLNQPVAEEVASAELSKPLQSVEDSFVEDKMQTGNPFDINEQLSEPPSELATAQHPPLQLSNEISTPEYEKLEKDIEASEQYHNRIANCDCSEEFSVSGYDALTRTIQPPHPDKTLLFGYGEESSQDQHPAINVSQVEHLLGLTSSNLEGYSEENIHLVSIPPTSNQETVSEVNDPQDMAKRFNNISEHDLAPVDDTLSAGIVQNQELTQELLEPTHAPPPTPLLTQQADPVDFTLGSESISEVVERLTVQEPEVGIQESKESTVDILIETGSSAQNLKESSVPEPEVQQSEAKTLEEAKTEEGVPESPAAPEGVAVAATAAAAAAVAVVSGAAAVAASATPSEKDTKKAKEGPAKKVAPSLAKRPSSEKSKTAAKPPVSSRMAATPPARPKLPTSAPKVAAVQKTASPKSTTNVPSKPAAKPPVTKSAPKTVTAPPRSAVSTVTNRTQGSPRAPGSMASATVNLAKARPTSSLEKKPLTNGDVKATSKSTGPLAAKTTATKALQRPASAPVSKVASRTVSATSTLNKAKPSLNGISKPKPLTSVTQVNSAAKTSNEKEIKESANKQISTRTSTTARTTTAASRTSAKSSLQKPDSKIVANGKISAMKASSLTKTSATTANSRITAKKPVTTTNLKPNKTESIVEKSETLQGSKTVIATNE